MKIFYKSKNYSYKYFGEIFMIRANTKTNNNNNNNYNLYTF